MISGRNGPGTGVFVSRATGEPLWPCRARRKPDMPVLDPPVPEPSPVASGRVPPRPFLSSARRQVSLAGFPALRMEEIKVGRKQPTSRTGVWELHVAHARCATTFPCERVTEELSELRQSCFEAVVVGSPSGASLVGICWGACGGLSGAGQAAPEDAAAAGVGFQLAAKLLELVARVNLDNTTWLCLPPAGGIRCAGVLVVSFSAAALRRCELFWSKA